MNDLIRGVIGIGLPLSLAVIAGYNHLPQQRYLLPIQDSRQDRPDDKRTPSLDSFITPTRERLYLENADFEI